MRVLLYMETKGGSVVGSSLELLTIGEQLAPGNITILAKDAFADMAEDEVSKILSDVAAEYDILLLSATARGKTVAALTAGRCDAACANNVTEIANTDEGLVAIRPVYAGKIMEKSKINANQAVLSIMPGAYERPEAFSGTVAVDAIRAKYPMADVAGNAESNETVAKILDAVSTVAETIAIEDAKIVVAGGRGMGNAENFALCQDLADALGGVVGATLPVVDNGWMEKNHQIGQSGKTVQPDLYFACGISGAPQHQVGMSQSGYIVAINMNPNAPIFDIANLGIIGDVRKLLPRLTEEIRKRKSEG